jgi:hypothetical protein
LLTGRLRALVLGVIAIGDLNCIFRAGGTSTPQDFDFFLTYNLNAATDYSDRGFFKTNIADIDNVDDNGSLGKFAATRGVILC